MSTTEKREPDDGGPMKPQESGPGDFDEKKCKKDPGDGS